MAASGKTGILGCNAVRFKQKGNAGAGCIRDGWACRTPMKAALLKIPAGTLLAAPAADFSKWRDAD